MFSALPHKPTHSKHVKFMLEKEKFPAPTQHERRKNPIKSHEIGFYKSTETNMI